MAKLKYLTNVWDNLEESYAKYCKNNPITKKEYLKLLIAYDANVGGSTILENYLSDEIELYSAEEFELYDNLRNLFNKVHEKLRGIGVREIATFNDLLEIQDREYYEEDFNTIVGRVCVDPAILLKKGYLMSTTLMEDGVIHSYSVENSADYIILNDARQLTEFLYNDDNIKTEFGKIAYAALMSLAKSGKLTVPIVIMSNKYFTVKGKYVTAGAIRHSFVPSDLGKITFDTLNKTTCETIGKFIIFKTKVADKQCTVIGVQDVNL